MTPPGGFAKADGTTKEFVVFAVLSVLPSVSQAAPPLQPSPDIARYVLFAHDEMILSSSSH